MFWIVNWENKNGKHIGKSNCGRYHAQIYLEGELWHYCVYMDGVKYTCGANTPKQTLQEAKEVVQNLVSLSHMQI